MTTSDKIAHRAARAVFETMPRGAVGDLITVPYAQLVTNIKSQMLNLLKEEGVLEEKA